MFEAIGNPSYKLLSINNKSPIPNIRLVPDAQFRVEFKDNNTCIGRLAFNLKSPDTPDFEINIQSQATYKYLHETKEDAHQKCFDNMFNHAIETIKQASILAGFTTPLELPFIKPSLPKSKKVHLKLHDAETAE